MVPLAGMDNGRWNIQMKVRAHGCKNPMTNQQSRNDAKELPDRAQVPHIDLWNRNQADPLAVSGNLSLGIHLRLQVVDALD